MQKAKEPVTVSGNMCAIVPPAANHSMIQIENCLVANNEVSSLDVTSPHAYVIIGMCYQPYSIITLRV